MPQPSRARVSSTVTKPNPRPRKYGSAAERQAAYRARAPEVCFRAEAKTVETLDRIAETIDQSRADLLLSMTKFALANHDWARFGLTHRPLPYGYGVSENLDETRKDNPMKKPTPAQLAARARFAEMARSGAFKKKAAKAKKAKVNPAKKTVSHKVKAAPRKTNPAKRSGWRITVLDDNNEPITQTFDTEEQGALLYAKSKADANQAGEITRVLPKSQKLAYWFDGTGIHPAGSYGDRPIYKTRRAQLKTNPATGRKASRTKLNPIVPEARSRLPSNFKYGVQTKATENWGLQAAFKTKAEAVDYAHAIAKNYPRLPIRVITFTGGPI